jgi:hypothetical protein
MQLHGVSFLGISQEELVLHTTEVAHIIELPLSVLDDALVVDTNMSTSYADNIHSGF